MVTSDLTCLEFIHWQLGILEDKKKAIKDIEKKIKEMTRDSQNLMAALGYMDPVPEVADLQMVRHKHLTMHNSCYRNSM